MQDQLQAASNRGSLLNVVADCFGYFLSAKMHPEAPFKICLPGIQENIPLKYLTVFLKKSRRAHRLSDIAI